MYSLSIFLFGIVWLNLKWETNEEYFNCGSSQGLTLKTNNQEDYEDQGFLFGRYEIVNLLE